MTDSREPMLDRWGRAPQGMSLALVRFLYESWFRVEWRGLEHIPRDGGALLVANHAGMLPVDGGIISFGVEHEIGRPVHSLAHHGFWRYPFIGKALSRAGGVVGHPDNAHRLLNEEKGLVLVMPEGAKGPQKPARERYQLQRFGRAGFVETAMRAGVPIVPVALMGTEDTTPTLATLRIAGEDLPITINMLLFGPLLGVAIPFPAKIRACVLPPVHFDEPPNLHHYSRSVLMDHAEGIRVDLQTALSRMLNARKSVWRG
jgi:1-acyl-sn-glycerol-3-phosphate acyltransferase